MAYRSQPFSVRRYQTSAGAFWRKLRTKSLIPSLSRSAMRLPVCCFDSPGIGKSPFLLERSVHWISAAKQAGMSKIAVEHRKLHFSAPEAQLKILMNDFMFGRRRMADIRSQVSYGSVTSVTALNSSKSWLCHGNPAPGSATKAAHRNYVWFNWERRHETQNGVPRGLFKENSRARIPGIKRNDSQP